MIRVVAAAVAPVVTCCQRLTTTTKGRSDGRACKSAEIVQNSTLDQLLVLRLSRGQFVEQEGCALKTRGHTWLPLRHNARRSCPQGRDRRHGTSAGPPPIIDKNTGPFLGPDTCAACVCVGDNKKAIA